MKNQQKTKKTEKKNALDLIEAYLEISTIKSFKQSRLASSVNFGPATNIPFKISKAD